MRVEIGLFVVEGVETVKADSDAGKVIVTGKVDPTKVRDNLVEKIRKKVELVSPQPKKEHGNEKENKDAKPNNKSENNKTQDQKNQGQRGWFIIGPQPLPPLFL